MDHIITEPLYTIHYTDDKGETYIAPIYLNSILNDVIHAIQAAPGYRIDRIVNHAA